MPVMLRDVARFRIPSREADPSAGRTGSRDSTHGSDEFAQRHLSRTVPSDRRGLILAIRRDLELIEWLGRLGFEETWIGEHHSAG